MEKWFKSIYRWREEEIVREWFIAVSSLISLGLSIIIFIEVTGSYLLEQQ